MTGARTREQEYGISGKSLANRSRRKIAAIRRLLAEIDAPWADVDNTVVMAADELRGYFDDFEKAIDNAVEYLKQEPGT